MEQKELEGGRWSEGKEGKKGDDREVKLEGNWEGE